MTCILELYHGPVTGIVVIVRLSEAGIVAKKRPRLSVLFISMQDDGRQSLNSCSHLAAATREPEDLSED